ncbi:MAG TPA: acetyl-CoA carboxylase biotin carboxyl carrier protein [Candidatus Acidoferrum sp.]|nr:acetyl-CoA carboxylase biotin carboxyl carrier protein [Candidatus Acidoferrum sp.]
MKKAKQKSTAASGSRVDLKEMERLLAFMAHHGLEELEYQRGAVHIRLRKASQGDAANPAPAVLHSMPGSAAAAEERRGGDPASKTAAAEEQLHIVKSPIVGTFYEAATPGSDPFVKVGQRVKAGQVLCIIEAMKLMNEIEADRAGEVARCLVENGQPVEYGQPLFALRPAPGAPGN